MSRGRAIDRCWAAFSKCNACLTEATACASRLAINVGVEAVTFFVAAVGTGGPAGRSFALSFGPEVILDASSTRTSSELVGPFLPETLRRTVISPDSGLYKT